MFRKNYALKIYLSKVKIISGFLLIFLLTFALITSFSGCSRKTDFETVIKSKLSGNDKMNAAVGVVNNFFKAIIAGNVDEAYNLISSYNKKTHSIDDFKKDLRNVTKIIEVKINWVEVKNNIANIGIDLVDSYDNEEKVYKDLIVSLVKEEDGSWKINFWN